MLKDMVSLWLKKKNFYDYVYNINIGTFNVNISVYFTHIIK